MLKQNTYTTCRWCGNDSYFQLDTFDTFMLWTCHTCKQSYKRGHGRLFMMTALYVEEKYIRAYGELSKHVEYVDDLSIYQKAKLMHDNGYTYDKDLGLWAVTS